MGRKKQPISHEPMKVITFLKLDFHECCPSIMHMVDVQEACLVYGDAVDSWSVG
jgi:hypothetical protein